MSSRKGRRSGKFTREVEENSLIQDVSVLENMQETATNHSVVLHIQVKHIMFFEEPTADVLSCQFQFHNDGPSVGGKQLSGTALSLTKNEGAFDRNLFFPAETNHRRSSSSDYIRKGIDPSSHPVVIGEVTLHSSPSSSKVTGRLSFGGNKRRSRGSIIENDSVNDENNPYAANSLRSPLADLKQQQQPRNSEVLGKGKFVINITSDTLLTSSQQKEFLSTIINEHSQQVGEIICLYSIESEERAADALEDVVNGLPTFPVSPLPLATSIIKPLSSIIKKSISILTPKTRNVSARQLSEEEDPILNLHTDISLSLTEDFMEQNESTTMKESKNDQCAASGASAQEVVEDSSLSSPNHTNQGIFHSQSSSMIIAFFVALQLLFVAAFCFSDSSSRGFVKNAFQYMALPTFDEVCRTDLLNAALTIPTTSSADGSNPLSFTFNTTSMNMIVAESQELVVQVEEIIGHQCMQVGQVKKANALKKMISSFFPPLTMASCESNSRSYWILRQFSEMPSGFQLVHPRNEKCLAIQKSSNDDETDFLQSFDEFSHIQYPVSTEDQETPAFPRFLLKLVTCEDVRGEGEGQVKEISFPARTAWKLTEQGVLHPFHLSGEYHLRFQNEVYVYVNSTQVVEPQSTKGGDRVMSLVLKMNQVTAQQSVNRVVVSSVAFESSSKEVEMVK